MISCLVTRVLRRVGNKDRGVGTIRWHNTVWKNNEIARCNYSLIGLTLIMLHIDLHSTQSVNLTLICTWCVNGSRYRDIVVESL